MCTYRLVKRMVRIVMGLRQTSRGGLGEVAYSIACAIADYVSPSLAARMLVSFLGGAPRSGGHGWRGTPSHDVGMAASRAPCHLAQSTATHHAAALHTVVQRSSPLTTLGLGSLARRRRHGVC